MYDTRVGHVVATVDAQVQEIAPHGAAKSAKHLIGKLDKVGNAQRAQARAVPSASGAAAPCSCPSRHDSHSSSAPAGSACCALAGAKVAPPRARLACRPTPGHPKRRARTRRPRDPRPRTCSRARRFRAAAKIVLGGGGGKRQVFRCRAIIVSAASARPAARAARSRRAATGGRRSQRAATPSIHTGARLRHRRWQRRGRPTCGARARSLAGNCAAVASRAAAALATRSTARSAAVWAARTASMQPSSTAARPPNAARSTANGGGVVASG